jgi:hypothetical protein
MEKSNLRIIGAKTDPQEESSESTTIHTGKFVVSVLEHKGSVRIEIQPLSGSSIFSRLEGIVYSLFKSTPPTNVILSRQQGRTLMNAIRRIVEKTSQRPMSKR